MSFFVCLFVIFSHLILMDFSTEIDGSLETVMDILEEMVVRRAKPQVS